MTRRTHAQYMKPHKSTQVSYVHTDTLIHKGTRTPGQRLEIGKRQGATARRLSRSAQSSLLPDFRFVNYSVQLGTNPDSTPAANFSQHVSRTQPKEKRPIERRTDYMNQQCVLILLSHLWSPYRCKRKNKTKVKFTPVFLKGRMWD